MTTPLRLPAVACLSLLLSACSLFRTPAPEIGDGSGWAAQRNALAQIHGFEMQGRLRSGLVSGASINWLQDGERFEAYLAGPFGSGALALSGNPVWVRVRSGNDEWLTPDPEGWMQATLGWRLPVEGLRYWAVGLPAPGLPAVVQTDPQGRLATLEQDGWHLVYAAYQNVDGLELPRRIELDDGSQRAILLIDRWPSIDLAP
jgi:outer membrane lipoprotein LolB